MRDYCLTSSNPAPLSDGQGRRQPVKQGSVVNKASRHKAMAKAPSHKVGDWTYMNCSTQTHKSSWKARLALLTVHTCFNCVSIKKISQIRQLLHLRETSISSSQSVIRARCDGLTSNPLWEKTCFTGTEVAGHERSCSNSLRRSLLVLRQLDQLHQWCFIVDVLT